MPLLLLPLTALLSVAACYVYLRLARRWQLLDMPNERSSHTLPTPHGGGVALLLAFATGAALSDWWVGPWLPAFAGLIAGALLLGALGIADDIWQLSRRLRFAAYGLMALATVGYLLPLSGATGFVIGVVCAVALLWLINLYNFMDGTDGIAATQAFVALSGIAVLSFVYSQRLDYPLFCLLFAFAHLGFLVWNWQPARLFMGDSGSVATGYLLGGLAILGVVLEAIPLACWLILLAVFVSDATFTLLWRMATGQAFLSPHRLHLYQRLAQHWHSHQAVVFALLAVESLWLLPLSAGAMQWPEYGLFLVILAYVPLLLAMVKLRHLT